MENGSCYVGLYTGYYYFFLFMAAPVAHGSSQARGRIGAASATATATADLSHIYDLSPLSKARDRACILWDITSGS